MTLTVPLTPTDQRTINNSTELRYQVGVVKPGNASLDLSSVTPEHLAGGPKDLPFGRIQRTDNGFTWNGSIESPGAAALRVHFSNLFLPNNATLTISGPGEAFTYTGQGPDGSGEFWSNTIRGARVELRVDYAGNDIGRVLQALRFAIAEVGPISDRLPGANPQVGEQLCPYNEACTENAACSNLPAAVVTAQKAVAMILFISGPYQYVCSGGLIADGDAGSNIPYFMTANHCLSSGNEAASVEAYFDYKSACGVCDDGISDEPRVLGSTVSASNRTSDYTLLRLSGLPAGADASWFLTKNSTAIANANGTNLYRISHPAGAPQAYSAHVVDTGRVTCQSWPRGNWIYSSDTFGATEGGSSGSPVVNAQGQFVGQLSGACGYAPSDPCAKTQNATVDGAYAAYASAVAPILGATSCTDADGDGVCAPQDCNDSNPLIKPGAAEVCTDGVDNNCNGATDSADASCQGGGCDLGGAGTPCTSNGQCCSGTCKGKPGAKTCK